MEIRKGRDEGLVIAVDRVTPLVVLAVAFGLWARRLRPRPGGSEFQIRSGAPEGLQAQVDALEGEMAKLRQELTESQERLDFVERMLAQGRETRRVAPEP